MSLQNKPNLIINNGSYSGDSSHSMYDLAKYPDEEGIPVEKQAENGGEHTKHTVSLHPLIAEESKILQKKYLWNFQDPLPIIFFFQEVV